MTEDAATLDQFETSNETTRSEHHADSGADEVREAKRRIAAVLRWAEGRDNAVPAATLAAATGPDGIAESTVRDAVKELRIERGIPVVSCGDGYYLADTVEEYRRAIEAINDEIATREQTKEEIRQAFCAYHGVAERDLPVEHGGSGDA